MKKILTVGLTALLLFSCSPTKRLERIVANHPELATTTVDTIILPKVSIDTFIDVRYDSILLEGAIDSILVSYPDCDNCDVAKEIVKYINTTMPFKDTLNYTEVIENDSLFLALNLTVWQDGTYVKIRTTLEDAEIKYVTRTIEIIDPPKKWPILAAIGAVLLLLLIILFKNVRF